jgi:hypothetical protein
VEIEDSIILGDHFAAISLRVFDLTNHREGNPGPTQVNLCRGDQALTHEVSLTLNALLRSRLSSGTKAGWGHRVFMHPGLQPCDIKRWLTNCFPSRTVRIASRRSNAASDFTTYPCPPVLNAFFTTCNESCWLRKTIFEAGETSRKWWAASIPLMPGRVMPKRLNPAEALQFY